MEVEEGSGDTRMVLFSGYPTLTIHLKRVAVARAHVVLGPAAVGSR